MFACQGVGEDLYRSSAIRLSVSLLRSAPEAYWRDMSHLTNWAVRECNDTVFHEEGIWSEIAILTVHNMALTNCSVRRDLMLQ